MIGDDELLFEHGIKPIMQYNLLMKSIYEFISNLKKLKKLGIYEDVIITRVDIEGITENFPLEFELSNTTTQKLHDLPITNLSYSHGPLYVNNPPCKEYF